MFGPNGTKPLENADDFNRDFEELVTSHCFGDVWDREGLTQRERSLLTCAMLVSLNPAGRSCAATLSARSPTA